MAKIPSIHMIHGIKTAVAAVLAYLITGFFGFEFGYWAVISAVIVMQVYVADSVKMCFYRFSGTLIGAFLGVTVLALFPENSFWVGIELFLTIGLCSFLTHYNTRYRMAAITVVIVIMTAQDAPQIVLVGVSRVLEIGIGILCAFVVSVVVLPRRKVDVLKHNLSDQAKGCSEKYQFIVRSFLDGQQSIDADFLEPLPEGIWSNHEILENIRQHEALIYPRQFSRNLAVQVATMNRVLGHLRAMIRTLSATENKGFDIIMKKELQILSEKSGNMLVKLSENRVSSEDRAEVEQALQDADARLLELRRQGVTHRFDLKKLLQVFAFYNSMHHFADDLLDAAGRADPAASVRA
ncbi:MAG: FUSC family protein [Desulfobacteraceae bacterium]